MAVLRSSVSMAPLLSSSSVLGTSLCNNKEWGIWPMNLPAEYLWGFPGLQCRQPQSSLACGQTTSPKQQRFEQ